MKRSASCAVSTGRVASRHQRASRYSSTSSVSAISPFMSTAAAVHLDRLAHVLRPDFSDEVTLVLVAMLLQDPEQPPGVSDGAQRHRGPNGLLVAVGEEGPGRKNPESSVLRWHEPAGDDRHEVALCVLRVCRVVSLLGHEVER